MKNKVNGIFRKVCNILEWIISAILVVVVAVMCVRFVFDLGGMFDSAPVEFFETFVADIMTLAVGVELIKMLSQHTPATVVEVLMFAIAREMVTHHDSALNTALGVLSICVLFATRKFFFCKNDYDDNNAKEEVDAKDARASGRRCRPARSHPSRSASSLGGWGRAVVLTHNTTQR